MPANHLDNDYRRATTSAILSTSPRSLIARSKSMLVSRALGAALTRLEQFEEAESLLLDAYEVIRAAKGDAAGETRRALTRLVDLYEACDNPRRRHIGRSGPPGKKTGDLI